MLFEAEVVRFERSGGLDVETFVEQNRAEDETLRVYVSGKTLFDGAWRDWWQTWREFLPYAAERRFAPQ